MKSNKPKNERTLQEWFQNAIQTRREYLTVPPHIVKLSCGCTREFDGKPFEIVQNSKGFWCHCGCGIIDLPQTKVYSCLEKF